MKATRGRALSSAQTGNPIVPDSPRSSERAARAAAVAARRAAGHGLAAVVVVGRGERARAGAALISRCVAPGEGRGERQPWQRHLQSRLAKFRYWGEGAGFALLCWRLAKTPASSPCLPAAAGVWVGPPGSARLGAGLRARRRRRASIARRSTGAYPVCSGHAVEHRQLSGRVYRARAGRLGRDCALNTTTTTCSRTGPPTAGLCGAPLDGRLLLTLPTASAVSLLSL